MSSTPVNTMGLRRLTAWTQHHTPNFIGVMSFSLGLCLRHFWVLLSATRYNRLKQKRSSVFLVGLWHPEMTEKDFKR